MKKKDDLATKIRKAIRARQLGQKNYKKADALVKEIATEVEVGQVIKVSADKGYKLVDEFSGKDIVWTPCGARRYSLEEVSIG